MEQKPQVWEEKPGWLKKILQNIDFQIDHLEREIRENKMEHHGSSLKDERFNELHAFEMARTFLLDFYEQEKTMEEIIKKIREIDREIVEKETGDGVLSNPYLIRQKACNYILGEIAK